MSDVQEIFDEMQKMVDKNAVFKFKSIFDKDDEDYFEPFEGKPVFVGSEMFVEVTKGNGNLKEGSEVMVDPNEFCFMDIEEVKG